MYRVNLLADQSLNLLIVGDGVNDDLDLGLADLSGKLLDAAVSQNRVESLAVKTSGDYLVIVTAKRGASNYVLTIGQSLTPASTGTQMRLSDAFVAGKAIVLFKKNAAGGLRTQAQALSLIETRADEPDAVSYTHLGDAARQR